jgi:hypothetical protein
LPPRALAFRLLHIGWGVLAMGALTNVWWHALTRRRSGAVWASAAMLLAQALALLVGRGNCPLGPFQRQLGDPVPMFELVLPPRAAKAAVPTLFMVGLVGLVTLLLRPPPRRVSGP